MILVQRGLCVAREREESARDLVVCVWREKGKS